MTMNNKRNYHTLNHDEQQTRDDFLSFLNTETIQKTGNRLCKLQLPLDITQISYIHFRNIIKLIYTYKTTFHEQHIRKANEPLVFPTCGEIGYSKGWRAQHRRNRPICIQEYYRELELMNIRTTPNCGLIFETHQDREKHEKYHCGNPANGYNNNGQPGKIDRSTPYGFRIPKTDMRYFDDNVLFDSNAQSWKCLLCSYTRDKHQRYQVFGHTAAMRGYTSRTPNERRGIRIQDKYSGEDEINPPQELRTYMTAEIDNRRILILVGENNEIRWQCGYCGGNTSRKKAPPNTSENAQ